MSPELYLDRVGDFRSHKRRVRWGVRPVQMLGGVRGHGMVKDLGMKS